MIVRFTFYVVQCNVVLVWEKPNNDVGPEPFTGIKYAIITTTPSCSFCIDRRSKTSSHHNRKREKGHVNLLTISQPLFYKYSFTWLLFMSSFSCSTHTPMVNHSRYTASPQSRGSLLSSFSTTFKHHYATDRTHRPPMQRQITKSTPDQAVYAPTSLC